MKKGLRFAPVLALWLFACGAPATHLVVSRPTPQRAQVTPTLDLMAQILSQQPTPAPTPSPTPPGPIATLAAPVLASKVDEYFQSLVANDDFSGAVLVARGGKVVISKGFGLADRTHKVANTPHTKFRIGSITKTFTAMAILLLHASGKLSVHGPICTYVPDCPPAWQPITIHHLLTHTSGIPNYLDFPNYNDTKNQPTTPSAIIADVKSLPLDFAPGTQYRYSNTGYVVLGYIIERVSGQSYAAFLRDHIFHPLQLLHTAYYRNDANVAERAVGYLDERLDADPIDMSRPYAASGIYSTVEDLYRWDQALYTERLVPQPVLTQMFTPFAHVAHAGTVDVSYGYGWFIQAEPGRRVILHGGGIEGFRSELVRYPDAHVTIIVLSNWENVDLEKIHMRLEQLVFEGR